MWKSRGFRIGVCGLCLGAGLSEIARARVSVEKDAVPEAERSRLLSQEGQTVVVTMQVQGVDISGDGAWLELYSTEKWDDAGCVFFRIPSVVTNRLSQWGGSDLNSIFLRRRVQVEERLSAWFLIRPRPTFRLFRVWLLLRQRDSR